jgi:hypothetical protein
MDIKALLILLLLSLGLALWFKWRQRADVARAICRSVCTRANVVLIDDTVSFKRAFFRQGRSISCYEFLYTRDGHKREHGSVWLDGMRVDYVAFEDPEGVTLVSPEAQNLP